MATYRCCKVCDGVHNVERWPHNCMEPFYDVRGDYATPSIAFDRMEYQSRASGKMITSKSQQREDLKRTNNVVWEPGMEKGGVQAPFTPGKYANPYFALKRGLPLNDKGEERLEEMRRDGRLEEYKRAKRKHNFPDRVRPKAPTL